METIKNFLMGLFITLFALVLLMLGFFLWPFMLGIGSLVLFLAVIVVTIILVFYLVVFIGYIVRKGLKGKG